MKRFVSLILSVCFLFSINTVSYAANISSRKASNPVIQSMNDKYHVDFSGMSIDELNKFIDKMKDEDPAGIRYSFSSPMLPQKAGATLHPSVAVRIAFPTSSEDGSNRTAPCSSDFLPADISAPG